MLLHLQNPAITERFLSVQYPIMLHMLEELFTTIFGKVQPHHIPLTKCWRVSVMNLYPK